MRTPRAGGCVPRAAGTQPPALWPLRPKSGVRRQHAAGRRQPRSLLQCIARLVRPRPGRP
eukprot:8705982-Lingulodinium_polyedra.AAC.1